MEKKRAKPRLGDTLKEVGVLSEADLHEALQEQREQKDQSVFLGEILLRRGLVSKDQLAAALQSVTRIPFVECKTLKVDKAAMASMTHETALRYCCLPMALRGRELVVAMAEPQNLLFLDNLRFITGLEISPRLGFREDIERSIEKYFRANSSGGEENTQGIRPQSPELEINTLEKDFFIPGSTLVAEIAPDMEFFSASSHQRAREAIKEFQASLVSQPTAAVRLVSNIISAADGKRASDIHIDPQTTDTVVRLRVDGILRDIVRVPQELSSHLVSRIKILADLDIAERRMPQDGRFLVRIGQRKFDLRVSTLPTHYGEKVVIRLLPAENTHTSLRNLGFSEEHSQELLRVLAEPQGLLLVCGPTGSGKSTTLYAALNHMSTRTVNIITVEDPIEYMLEGINQVQVNVKAGLTFAGSLRSILRQDPNIVMVGEIRDSETAEIALTAAQTGHFVLSTLHTNDSVAAIDRLRDLGIPAFLIASSLSVVVAQRLLRKLCTCRVEGSLPSGSLESLEEMGCSDLALKSYLPAGCDLCDHTGYKGRIGVYEVLLIHDEIRRLIQNEAGSEAIRAIAAGSRFRFMQEDAIEKVKAGITSCDEMLRVIPSRKRSSFPCRECGRNLPAAFAFCPYCGLRTAEAQQETREPQAAHSAMGKKRF